jgi:5-methylcytosine-specific restriction endonuclease McrA
MSYKTKNHYEKNKEIYNKRLAIQRKLIRKYLQSIKEAFNCADCKRYFPYYVMDFDHVKGKSFQISHRTLNSFDALHKEIAKCEIVCSNCHRIRTHRERDHKKTSLKGRSSIGQNAGLSRRRFAGSSPVAPANKDK